MNKVVANRSAQAPRLLSIYDGRTCVGFLLERGRSGFEAPDSTEHSLGTFDDITGAFSEPADTATATCPG